MLEQLLTFVLSIISFFVGYHLYGFLYKKFCGEDKIFILEETEYLDGKELDNNKKYFNTKEEMNEYFNSKIEIYKRDWKNEIIEEHGNIYTHSYEDNRGCYKYKLKKL